VKTPQQRRREERREAQLDLIREQVESGRLVIRKMTPEERAKNPARPQAKTKRRARRA
jgi:hypothetical protein